MPTERKRITQYRLIPLVYALGVVVFSAPFSIAASSDKPQSLNALFQPLENSQKKKVKAKVPGDYPFYMSVKASLEKDESLEAIESLERRILQTRMNEETRALEKDFDEYFYALELRRGEQLSKRKLWKKSRDAFARALNGMGSYKWIYYWRESTSEAIFNVCHHGEKSATGTNRKTASKTTASEKSHSKVIAKKPSDKNTHAKPNEKNKNTTSTASNEINYDDYCLSLAKKVVDAFPKAASEVKVLRSLPNPDSVSNPEVNGDRLAQTYTEKTEKDEVDFQPVLSAFLEGNKSSLLSQAKSFISDYPKSILRFRAQFLMAEVNFKSGNRKEADPLYQGLIDQLPLSFYSVIAAERLGKPLQGRVKKDALKVDPNAFNLTALERNTLTRADALFAHKHYDEVGKELEQLTRTRAYSDSLLYYLMGYGTRANQDLYSFRLATELIQRRSDKLFYADFIDMIFTDRYLPMIEPIARDKNLDPLLVLSLMKQESGFRADILSSSGAAGLMQLMPFTAIEVKRDLKLADLRDPKNNIEVGTQYFSALMEKYAGNPVFALAAYNAGPHRVAKWRKEAKGNWGMIEFIEAIPYKETRDYVMSILRNRYWYGYKRNAPNLNVLSYWREVNAPATATEPYVKDGAVSNAPTASPSNSPSPNPLGEMAPAPNITPQNSANDNSAE